ncbi:hypothetical protein NE562_05565 [Butyricicoccus faecihominis]|uniref:hypothetical protein n=1 Tax=Butyricicoccus faecihominis TaxID=1712515 RepID=UPI00247859FB|nr:hypothetical protein [Butyricicoccus faecihominis]MCQ5129120.1 hypothetical protein [Butyricicoccus faecihominis]
MTTKQWLMRARRIDNRVRALSASKHEVYDRAIAATAQIKDMPGSSGGAGGSKSEQYAVLSAEVDEQIAELRQVKAEILRAIHKMQDSTLATLLIEYYVNCNTWEQVAVDLGFSWRHIQRLHGRALKKFEDVMECHIPPAV